LQSIVAYGVTGGVSVGTGAETAPEIDGDRMADGGTTAAVALGTAVAVAIAMGGGVGSGAPLTTISISGRWNTAIG
jgi:hypothetical protein